MLKQTAHTLQDDFEYHGLWWLPGQSENKLSGTLRYDGQRGARLSTAGTFGTCSPESAREPFSENVILGLTSNGIKCTLVDNVRSNFRMNMPGISEEQFRSQYLVMGEHFASTDILKFQSFDASFQYVEEWVGRTLETEILQQDGRTTGYNIKVASKMLSEGPLPSGAGEVSLFLGYQTRSDTAAEHHVVTEVFLKFRPPTPQSLFFFEQLFFDVKRLLTLLIGESTYVRRMRAYLPGNKTKQKLPLGIYYRLPLTVTSNQFFQHMALIPFTTISPRLPTLLDRWLANAEKIRSVYDLFFSIIYKPDMYVSNRFLNLVYAVETYHRLLLGGKYLDPDEYQEIHDVLINSIPPATDPGLKAALKSRIHYGNEYSLTKRFKLLFRNLDEELVKLVTDDPTAFSRTIIDTRNYLVHRDPDLEALALNNEGMLYASHRLKILITILLLQSLGLSDNSIYHAISENRRYQPFDA